MHDSDWAGLDRFIENAMACWSVPGLAVGIVRGDELMLLKGYGVRDLDTGAPITADTQFMICSLTKSFTAAGIGLLVDEQCLRWETRVREILPDFRLRDPTATDEITVADLLTHRSGLPAHDRVWSPPGERSRSQMVRAMRHLQPTRKLREAFQYSNLGYVVAGMIAEMVSGRSWEDFTTQRLLGPVGFSRFGFSRSALESACDHAHPHEEDGPGVMRGKLWPMQATPAGGVNASVTDMARWVRFLLLRGCVDGRQLLSRASVKAMMTPHIDEAQSEFSEIGRIRYGYGLRCAHYRGNFTVSHTGSQPGWGTYMTMMPDHGIGVTVLTNRDPSPVCALIAYAVYDRLLSLAPLDWFDVFRRKQSAVLRDQDAQERARAVPQQSASPAQAPPEEIEGEYRHPAYGRIAVVQSASEVQWNWRGLSGILQHLKENTYQLREHGLPRYPHGIFVSLEMDATGHVVALRSPLEPAVPDIVFHREQVEALQ